MWNPVGGREGAWVHKNQMPVGTVRQFDIPRNNNKNLLPQDQPQPDKITL